MPGVLHSCNAQIHWRKSLAWEPSESQLLLGLEGVFCNPPCSVLSLIGRAVRGLADSWRGDKRKRCLWVINGHTWALHTLYTGDRGLSYHVCVVCSFTQKSELTVMQEQSSKSRGLNIVFPNLTISVAVHS